MCHVQRKFLKGYVNFSQNSGKGYDIWKKFQVESVILMAQTTNQKKIEFIDYFEFDLVWTKNAQF